MVKIFSRCSFCCFIYLSYNIFYGKNFIGQIKENDAIELFTKDQLIDFYYREKNKFKIPEETIQKLVKKPKSND